MCKAMGLMKPSRDKGGTPKLELGLSGLPSAGLPLPRGPHASRTFDLLIASPSGGFIKELPQLMSSPGYRAHTPSRWVSSKGYRYLGPWRVS